MLLQKRWKHRTNYTFEILSITFIRTYSSWNDICNLLKTAEDYNLVVCTAGCDVLVWPLRHGRTVQLGISIFIIYSIGQGEGTILCTVKMEIWTPSSFRRKKAIGTQFNQLHQIISTMLHYGESERQTLQLDRKHTSYSNTMDYKPQHVLDQFHKGVDLSINLMPSAHYR